MSKTYLVTGTSRGIGLWFVKTLKEQGHTVIATARNPDASEQLKAITGSNIHKVPLDITSQESIKAAVEHVNKLAPHGIDVLINNSGINEKKYSIDKIPSEEFSLVLNTNVVGTSSVTQAFLPLLRKANTRHIINISSIVGSLAITDTASIPVYRVSKAAVNMLSKLYSIQLSDEKFIVSAVHPGWVKTDMGGEEALITPAESVAGILEYESRLTSKDNGTYVDYQGKPLPW
ncbi:4-dihydrotrisporin dehydrogenase [Phycomyces blakesleeanus]|uniref:Uncharacterized protein n=2 Tax=Phycomyces blakesleeanus TaxID=4837 RepID=A0A162TRZ0_PHYB8|nr:hypothetical protein PHYBLDRAFT_21973 [Phycomyces blakesleeanus NRRL 1555(-)]OAD69293.1 hypothetical protein PHYBLDRAFT_21973 [Phycomyces blakesleeanus NRRL 1555(-)]|eukprot:XP_018287333.1 hypothetical protein PHYBLDRAFT_21973 [Phycomyces blakesleeanus NRRL 1555(-)]